MHTPIEIDPSTQEAIRATLARLHKCAKVIRNGQFDEARHGDALTDIQIAACAHQTALGVIRATMHHQVDAVVDGMMNELRVALDEARPPT